MEKFSGDLCDTYFRSVRLKSPEAYNIYLLLGKGDPARGYDEAKGLISKYRDEIRDYYWMIKELDQYKFKDIDKKIIRMKPDMFPNERSVRNKIWGLLWRTNGFGTAKSVYTLYEALDALKSILGEVKYEEIA